MNLGDPNDVLTPVAAPVNAQGVQQFYLPLGTSGFPNGRRLKGWGAISSQGDDPAGAGGRSIVPGLPTTPPNVCWLSATDGDGNGPAGNTDSQYFWFWLGGGEVGSEAALLFLPKPPPNQWWVWQPTNDPGHPYIWYTTNGLWGTSIAPVGWTTSCAPIGCRWVMPPAGTNFGSKGIPAVLLYDGSDGGVPHPTGASLLKWGADAYGAPSAHLLQTLDAQGNTQFLAQTFESGYDLPNELPGPSGPGGFYSQDNGLNLDFSNDSGQTNGTFPPGFQWVQSGSGFWITTEEAFGDWLIGTFLSDINAIGDISTVVNAVQGVAPNEAPQPGAALEALVGDFTSFYRNPAGTLEAAAGLPSDATVQDPTVVVVPSSNDSNDSSATLFGAALALAVWAFS